ncbi:MAG: hypothetical protein L3K09_04035 [Thermoplasmata archaeon]|nr:hypothetical protein [Thermoplasmata archaeon]
MSRRKRLSVAMAGTPARSPKDSSPQAGRRRRSAEGADRDALEFLEKRIAPTLSKERNFPLLRAVRSVLKSSRLTTLASMPERQRRDLLAMLEQAIEKRRIAVAPRVLVRLTSVISRAPAPDARMGRRFALPAR